MRDALLRELAKHHPDRSPPARVLVVPKIEDEDAIAPRVPLMSEIETEVRRFYSMSREKFLSHRRDKHIVRVRQVFMYLVLELTLHSLPDVGKHLGGRHHTTIMHGAKVIGKLLKTDTKMIQHIGLLKARLVA